MPRLSDIELFKTSLRTLGREPEILERWGEHWTEPTPPEQGVPDDLAALLGIESGMEEPEAFVEEPEAFAEESGILEEEPEALEEELESSPGTADSLPVFEDSPAPGTGIDTEESLPDFGEEPENPALDDTDFASFLDSIPLDESEVEPVSSLDEDSSLAPGDSGSLEAETGFPEMESGFGDLEVPDAFGIPEELDTISFEETDESSVPESLTAGLMDELGSIPDEDLASEPEDLEAFTESEPEVKEPSFDEPVDEGDFDFSDTLEPGSGEQQTSDYDSIEIPDMPDTIDSGESPGDSQKEPSESAPDSLAEMDIGSDTFDLGEDSFDLGGDTFDLGGDAGAQTGTGEEPSTKDSFDEFSLGGELSLDVAGSSDLPEFESADFELGTEGGDDIDKQLAALDSELPATDNFNLESSWGGDFSMPGFELGKEEKKPTQKSKATALPPAGHQAPRQVEEKVRDVSLTDAQVDALQDTLLSYPLNLRLAVEDILANAKGTEAQQSALIWKLVEGASARDAAKDAGKILKRYIVIPSGFEKRTGAAFEAEKGSFAYLLIHSILPMLQVIVLVAAGAGLLFFLGYNFAYRPIKAHTLYAEGRRQIEQRRYSESEEYFIKADKEWIIKSWYYRFAEAYAGMEEYPRAERMYEQLLSRWPNETEAALDYARMVSGNLGFEKAESILNTHILQRDYFNKDALILMVDNYLAWADLEEQRYEGPRPDILQKLYENTRFQLATLMEHHGQSDAYLQRMLTYFIRTERAGGTDKLKEVVGLANYFTGNPKSGFEPAVLAELADYLMDRNETGLVGTILSSAIDKDGTLPETYVALAKWNKRSDFIAEEVSALKYAQRFYEAQDEAAGLSPRRTKGYINSLIRLAELRMDSGEILDASENLNTAIGRYERALAERRFKPAPEFAKSYSLLADIHYRDWRDFPAALANYEKAERHGYTRPETDYRQGFIYYQDQTQASMERALQFFYRAGLEREPSPYLLLATGNTLLERSNFFAASGYYSMLVNQVQHELDTINLPRPQERRSHEEIVELLMVARNNLGVAKYRTAERMGDARQRSEAMVQFLASAKLFDSLSRDQVRMTRSETRNLGFLNTDFVLHPQRGIDLALYKDLPMEMIFPAE
jgi:hypothetical protein